MCVGFTDSRLISLLEGRRDVEFVFLYFFQTIQYVTRSKIIETETRELSSVSRGKIRNGEADDWKNEKLFVPPLPPTNLRGCHLIRIQYDVFVSVAIHAHVQSTVHHNHQY